MFGVDSVVSCFADDTRVTRRMSETVDSLLLQGDLERNYSWASSNNMVFNDDKFRLLQYRTSSRKATHRQYRTPGVDRVKQVSEIKDLGVLMSDSAKFSGQIQKVVRKARQIMG